jgi:hypothetical protein
LEVHCVRRRQHFLDQIAGCFRISACIGDRLTVGSLPSSHYTFDIDVASLHLDEMSAEGQLIIETGVSRVCVDEHPGYLPGFEMGEHLAVYGMG